jgi:hypothetical protein
MSDRAISFVGVVLDELPATCTLDPICTGGLVDTSVLGAPHRTGRCLVCGMKYVVQPSEGCACLPGACPAAGGEA